ncbi:hypothetical protein OKW41_005185 [Paraburkholderia sp. UCT70]
MTLRLWSSPIAVTQTDANSVVTQSTNTLTFVLYRRLGG